MPAPLPDRSAQASVPASAGLHTLSRGGWDGEQLAAFCAAGHPPRLLRRLVTQWPDPSGYREAWRRGPQQMAEAGWPDPDVDDIDLGDGWVVVAGDPDYPTQLLAVPSAPFLLFGRGERSCLAVPGVAVVGTREMTELGRVVADIAAAAAAGLGAPVVSGLAAGVDTEAHTVAVAAGAVTVAVVATGPDHCYPPQNASLVDDILEAGGVVVSEHPFRTEDRTAPKYRPASLPARLQARNRIIAGLSAVVVPCEGTVRSGTMGTVWTALGLGRPVLVAVPRPGAQMRPGAQIALALSSSRPLDGAQLRAVGAPPGAADRVAGRAPLASAAARDRDELALVIRASWWASPLHRANVSSDVEPAVLPAPATSTRSAPPAATTVDQSTDDGAVSADAIASVSVGHAA